MNDQRCGFLATFSRFAFVLFKLRFCEILASNIAALRDMDISRRNVGLVLSSCWLLSSYHNRPCQDRLRQRAALDALAS
jgi:hypothetical protein